ncbi:hypothetical protein A9P82_05805 [Arachidicoccus ginsenosidimutans]|uniref:hypothetical protein n=1 Tax=Arachidicoccus sp. BS20 TaxID=1850526 RepID=UPI0007F11144|nr:hypothetical protein [Arachidicoccus sp. BS20]ANI88845.1 hypothetical protein A9P82_05805 [Arachidicoccus sp. BS20]
MSYQMRTYSTLISISAAFLCSAFKYRRGDKAWLFLALYTGWSFTAECIATLCAYHYGNNLRAYSYTEPVNLLLASLYFNYKNRQLRRFYAGYLAGFAGVCIQAACLPYSTGINSIFTQYECVALTAFSLYHCYSVCAGRRRPAYPEKQAFIISLLFLLFFSGSFFIRASVAFFSDSATDRQIVHRLYALVYYLALIFYTGIAITLIFPRPAPKNLYHA